MQLVVQEVASELVSTTFSSARALIRELLPVPMQLVVQEVILRYPW